MKYLKVFNRSYELINNNTKKAGELVRRWCSPAGYSLDDVYHSYSYNKEYIYKQLEARRIVQCGCCRCVPTACKMFFTYAYSIMWEGLRYLIYITPSHDYAVLLSN